MQQDNVLQQGSGGAQLPLWKRPQQNTLWDITTLPAELIGMIGEYLAPPMRVMVTPMIFDLWVDDVLVSGGVPYHDDANGWIRTRLYLSSEYNGTIALNKVGRVQEIDARDKMHPRVIERDERPTDNITLQHAGEPWQCYTFADKEWHPRDGSMQTLVNGLWRFDVIAVGRVVTLCLCYDGSTIDTCELPVPDGMAAARLSSVTYERAQGDLIHLNVRYYDTMTNCSDEKMYVVKLAPMHT